MSEWKEYSLGEQALLSTSKIEANRVSLERYVSTDNLIPNLGGIELAKGLPNQPKYSHFKKGDVLFSNIRTYFKKVWQADFEGGCSNDVLVFRGKDNKTLNQDFLYYLLSNQKFIDYTAITSKGTKMPRGDKEAIKKFKILLPHLEEQKEIVLTLSNLDQKITLLREQNQSLEQLTQTLFKRWFVEFEYPNENEQPYKSSGGKMVESELGEIPEDWELRPLENLVKVHNGYSYKGSELQESNVAMVTLKNFDRKGGFRFDGFKELVSDRYKEKHIVDVGDLIVAHTDLTQDAEVLGNPALIMKNEKYTELVVSMDLVKVESMHKSLNTEFLYYLMRDKRFKYHCKGYANGTTVLHLSKSAIPEYLFPFPKDMTLIEEFGSYAYSVYQKISNNIEEIQSLTQLRDTLLPKLMSGELKINV